MLWAKLSTPFFPTPFLSPPSWFLCGWTKCQFPLELGLDPRKPLLGLGEFIKNSTVEIHIWEPRVRIFTVTLEEEFCLKGPWLGSFLRIGWGNQRRPCCCPLRMSLPFPFPCSPPHLFLLMGFLCASADITMMVRVGVWIDV